MAKNPPSSENIDRETVDGFGREWESFDQRALRDDELNDRFLSYFAIFPFDELPVNAEGFDLGCGSGRWARLIAPKVGTLHCIDPAPKALEVARQSLADRANVEFHLASVDSIPLDDASQDFGYSLGVLHHIPDPQAGLGSCVRKLKPDAPFLLYLYYDFENRSRLFRTIWKASDLGRRVISKLPFPLRLASANVIAATIYFPLTRVARAFERLGKGTENIPLSSYRNYSFYTMRTDALDRFGTRLERRFSRQRIADMMAQSGLTDIRFSETVPHWVACGRKKSTPAPTR